MPRYGSHLAEDQFENFSEAQLNQLLSLAEELHGDGPKVEQEKTSEPPITAPILPTKEKH